MPMMPMMGCYGRYGRYGCAMGLGMYASYPGGPEGCGLCHGTGTNDNGMPCVCPAGRLLCGGAMGYI